MASVIAANAWRGCAFSMILQFAGLQRIPRELHEAADLEGLRPWARLRMLILPQLAPVLALNLVLITIQTLNTFDLILPLTGGGPARRTEVDLAVHVPRRVLRPGGGAGGGGGGAAAGPEPRPGRRSPRGSSSAPRKAA